VRLMGWKLYGDKKERGSLALPRAYKPARGWKGRLDEEESE
jgi:hypothetical protein